ncbi:hypothetical protein EVAR_100372_1 [Eumeta japonica]|uniref:Uncharacterized protein n=1 Tax=Eumeta variegata TaxID=151549 RepID=A0A4C1SC00_EUMVA|nr:hypothetical protein EVAR_100372_1 [Eumeta japonica]
MSPTLLANQSQSETAEGAPGPRQNVRALFRRNDKSHSLSDCKRGRDRVAGYAVRCGTVPCIRSTPRLF